MQGAEIKRLKKIYAELSLEHEVVKEALQKSGRACRAAGLARRSYGHESKRQSDQAVEQAIEGMSRQHPG